MLKIACLLIVLGCSLFLSAPLLAQDEGGIEGMTLKLCDEAGVVVNTCTTNDDGSWSLVVPRSGEYSIAVAQTDFELALDAVNRRYSDSAIDASDGGISTSHAAQRSVMFSWSMKDDPSVACTISSRDASSGLPTGSTRKRAPVQFIREFDKSAPIITCKAPCTLSGNVSYTATSIKSGKSDHAR